MNPNRTTLAARTPRQRWRFLGQLVVGVLGFPFRMWIRFRRSMTTTTITLLLMSIITLNIVWGFPWLGMFAACIAIASIGISSNVLFRPAMRVDVKLPVSVPANQAFIARVHLTNIRRLPAMDLRIGFDATSRRSLLETDIGFNRKPIKEQVVVSAATPLEMIRPGAHEFADATLCYSERGIHTLPSVLVESSFPFSIIRAIVAIPTATQIAVTPRPLSSTDAQLAILMTKTIDELTTRSLIGESLQYTGSREYQVGVPVRRWDFGSWARLGKPIVREYQASALQTVWLFVDTAAEPDAKRQLADEELERVLSCAAAAIPQWLERMVRLRLYLTSEPPIDHVGEVHSEATFGSNSDAEILQIRLAVAARVDSVIADRRLVEMLAVAGRKPMLLLTARGELPDQIVRAANCQVVRVQTLESAK